MRILAVLGPTAAGKSSVALELARRSGAAIVSIDSMQVYRGMDIGTAKPGAAARRVVAHHMIDVADPGDEYSVAEFQRAGRRILARLEDEGTPAVIAGGSGLHFRALVDPLSFPPTDPAVRTELEAMTPEDRVGLLLAADPQAAAHIDLANPRRVVRALEIFRLTGATPSERAAAADARRVRDYQPELQVLAVGFDAGDQQRHRVVTRFDSMLEAGLVDEVRGLENVMGRTARQAVGYKELLPHVRGEVPLLEARTAAIGATLALTKRQRTFFRRDPRIRWMPWHDDTRVRTESVLEAAGELAWIS